MRTIVFGDVHGCLNELDELTYAVEYNQGVALVLETGEPPTIRARQVGARP